MTRRFWKMSGSGNDFVFFDAMAEPAGDLARPERISEICARRTGVGADGVVFLEPSPRHAFLMRYFNRDGSLAEMCGNAALCSTWLAAHLGIVAHDGAGAFTFDTTSGPVTARLRGDCPEVDMIPVLDMLPTFEVSLEPGEVRVGFARVGVPHLVVQVVDAATVEVERRGRALRLLSTLRDGANVSFVSPAGGPSPRADQWVIRTYERGVETETLACGTGAVAAAALLTAWGLAEGFAALQTRSGRVLEASLAGHGGEPTPILRGEGRLVFVGELAV
jgi:diaminopimelate epimerase